MEMGVEKKYSSVRFNKPEHFLNGRISTDTKGYRDSKVPTSFGKMLELLEREGRYADSGKDVYAKFYSQIGDKFYVIEENLAIAIGELVKQINASIQEAYDKGKEDGKKALILLNNGDMSITDFDKK